MNDKIYLLTGFGDEEAGHKLINKLAKRKHIRYIINHHPIIKVKTHKPQRFPCKALLTKDQTSHTDEHYWDLAMAIYRYEMQKQHPDSLKAVVCITHFMCNLWYVDEEELFTRWSKSLQDRRQSHTPQQLRTQDHGWEITALQKAGMKIGGEDK